MLMVIFEVEPHAQTRDRYFDIAAELKPILERVDGFISVERFESLSQPGKILSLSLWRDEAAIKAWRNLEQHRQAQALGRSQIFLNYRLRVTEIVREYSLHDREFAPADSRQAHDANIAKSIPGQ